MSNELSTEVIFDVDYQPSTISIVHEDQLARLINATVQRFEGLIFKEDDIADAKKARTELNRIFGLIDSKRKEVKKKINEPLVAFEKQIKAYSDEIKELSDGIGEQIKEFESKVKEERRLLVLAFIEKQANEFEIDHKKVKFRNNWTNASSFTPKNNLTKKTEEEIVADCLAIRRENDIYEQQKSLVKSYVKAYDLDPFSWITLLDQGLTAAQIFPKIDQAVKELRKKEEEEIKATEQEIKQNVTPEEPTQEPIIDEPKYSFTLKITGTTQQLSVVKRTVESLGVEYSVEME